MVVLFSLLYYSRTDLLAALPSMVIFSGTPLLSIAFNRESFGGQFVSVLGQQEVNGFPFFVNGSIQIAPFTFDLDVGLIHSPGGPSSFLPFLELNFQDRSIFDDPFGNLIEIYSYSYELTYSAGAYQDKL
jgi:hypothetical protein